jgi:D-3-phosphoglycerate dehydrogenase
MTDVEPPVVACLTPREVLEPTYGGLVGSLPPHRLVLVDLGDEAGRATALAASTVVVGDWTGQARLGAKDFALAAGCRAVVQPTAGYDSIDVVAAGAAGIPVANVPGANARGVAEWVVMASLLLLKEVPAFDRELRDGRWLMVEAAQRGVFELGARSIGIVGLGGIGLEVARRLLPFEPAEIVYADEREVATDIQPGHRLRRVELDELFAECDVVTLHVPLTPTTRHLVDAERLRLLGPDGVLVNTARGGIVDSPALRAALRSGQLKGAALDVFEDEPLGPGHPWAGVPRLLLSPHLAGSTNESRERMIRRCFETVALVLHGGIPPHVVNGAHIPKDKDRSRR